MFGARFKDWRHSCLFLDIWKNDSHHQIIIILILDTSSFWASLGPMEVRILRDFEDCPIVIIPNLYVNMASVSIYFDNVEVSAR